MQNAYETNNVIVGQCTEFWSLAFRSSDRDIHINQTLPVKHQVDNDDKCLTFGILCVHFLRFITSFTFCEHNFPLRVHELIHVLATATNITIIHT